MSSVSLGNKSKICFYLNGLLTEIDFSSNTSLFPHMSVLQFLREHSLLTGTKEGCGIGDCGACTICIIEKNSSGKIDILSVNSCLIMLGMLDNKHIISIEGVSAKKNLHPIQLELIEKRGSQCGFCSPGMVMSAYVHYLNNKPFTRKEIESTLSGNLCRCTGYESIIQALTNVDKYQRTNFVYPLPDFSFKELYVENRENTYIKPLTLKSLLKYKSQFPKYTLVSGASDISVKIKTENQNCIKLIDISDIYELRDIKKEEKEIILGANTSIEKADEVLSSYYPSIHPYLSTFASLQIRNKATMAGSVASASPVGDIMPLLLSINAKIKLSSINSSRVIDCKIFNTGYRSHVMQDDEVIESFIIPIPHKKRVLFCHKQAKRKDMDISSLTFCLSFYIENGIISNVHSGFGGLAAIPKNSPLIENFLENKSFTENTFLSARSLISKEFTPISDIRGSASYRLLVAENLLVKCYNDLK